MHPLNTGSDTKKYENFVILSLMLQKPESLGVKASEGEVVVLYYEPSATQNLKFSAFPGG